MSLREHRDNLLAGRQITWDRYGADPNVTACGLGYRWRDGQLTDEPAVVVAVAKKRPAAYVRGSRLLPSTVDVRGRTYGVDVIQAGPFYADGPPEAMALPISERVRPLRQGIQIGNVHGLGVGTLGCLVRDLSDDTICVLSNNHVIANSNAGKPGDPIFQPLPGPDNIIGTLKRFVPLIPGHLQVYNKTDAAIASVDEALVSKAVARDLMPPISSHHPAVGILAGGDGVGTIAYLPMDVTLQQLGVELLAKNAVASAGVGDNVDKVGRSSGYSSSTAFVVDAVIGITYSSGFDALFDNAVLSPQMGGFGDSGSVICAGGDGNTPVPGTVRPCYLLGGLGDMYDLPLTDDNPLFDRFRDEVLMLSPVGRMIIALVYRNSEFVLARIDGVEAGGTEKSRARWLYDKYRQFAEDAIDHPTRPGLVVTEEHIKDLEMVVSGFGLRAEPSEREAADLLFREFVATAKGMTYLDIMAKMRDPAVQRRVMQILGSVATIEVGGPFDGW